MEILPIEDKSVDRLLGRGGTSEGFLPYVLPPASTDEVSQKTERGKVGSGGTILFVEDEESIRGMTTMYLEAKGYRVINANDGAKAVMLWEKHEGEIDLVVTDLMMPGGLNGHQLVDQLKADRPNLKAIFVSGYGSDLFGESTFLDETTSFLPKPYRLKDLSELVQSCLRRDKAA